jgi:outer membrane protein assembly factor BamB
VIAKSLPSQPRRVWQLKVGEGLASPVVAGDSVYYLDAQGEKEMVHAIAKETASERWAVPLDGTFKNGQTAPGPRCTPLVDGDRVYVQSCNGELQCLSIADGKQLWRVNFTKDYHAGVPAERGVAKGAQRHGFTASPWVDGHRLIALVGDTQGAGVVCFDKYSGKVLWKSQNDRAANAAPITATIDNTSSRQVLAFTVEGLIGLDLANGNLLWRVPITTTYGRHVMTPVVVGNLAMVASKEESLMGIELVRDPADGKWRATTKWQAKEQLVNFSSPVEVGGFIYGLGPTKNLFCVEVASGKTMWSKEGFTLKPAENAHLSLVVLGENLLLLTETGTLVLVAADSTGYRELGRTQACGMNWCNPAYADGRVYLRDARELICLDLMAP